MKFLRAFVETVLETVLAWRADKASRLAAAMAYYTIFSLAPLLIILIASAGLVFGERAVQAEIAGQLEGLVGPGPAELIQTMIANVSQPQSNLFASLIGIVTMLLGASGLFGQLQDALNTIWHVPPPQNGSLWRMIQKRLWHFAMVFGVGGLLVLSVFASVAARIVTTYFHIGDLFQTLNALFSFILVTLAFAIVYKVLPDATIAWIDVWVGAVVTSLLFAVGKYGISLYMSGRNIGSAFGAAGSLIVLLVWVYYSTQIFLLGAKFTYIYAHKFGSQIAPHAGNGNGKKETGASD